MESSTYDDEAAQTDGGYGWVCVAACWIFNAFTWGGVSSYGIYLSYYLSQQSYPNASDVDFAFIGGLNISVAMAVAPFATYLARVCGPRSVMAAGTLLQAAGFIAASYCSQVWHLYLSQGISIGCGIGLIYIPSLPIISQWFSTRRSLANGLSASGSGFGGMLFSWTTALMLKRIGPGWTLRATGLMSFAANSIAVLLIRHRNHIIKPPQLAFDLRLLRRIDVVLLLSWSFLSMLGYVVLLFSLPDFATSIGLTQMQATNIAGFLNLGTAVGRPMIGILSDRFSRIDSAAVVTFICGVSCIAFWIPATSYALTIFFSIICGATLWVFWMVENLRTFASGANPGQTIGPLCVEVAGLKELQSLLSLAWISVIIPTTCSEVIALRLRRPTSTRPYLYPQIVVALSYVVATMLLVALRWSRRRIGAQANNA